MPLYFGFLILFFICWFVLVSKDTLATYPFYKNHWWEFFVFVQNWVFIKNYPPAAIHLNNLWSLAVEEQFYLLFPFLIILLKKPKKIAWVLLSLIVLIVVCRCLYYNYYAVSSSGNFKAIYWNTFLRVDTLLIGALLFIVPNYCKLPPFFFRVYTYFVLGILICTAYGIYYYREKPISFPFFDTIGFTLIAILFSYLLYKTIEVKNKYLIKIISGKWLIYIGKISFGIYIFHWPIYLLGFGFLNKILALMNYEVSDANLHIINVCLSLALTFALSHFSFKYFESYFLKWKQRM
jgi:peptidoglycan/LPS O-acetylase OafA/YrhL